MSGYRKQRHLPRRDKPRDPQVRKLAEEDRIRRQFRSAKGAYYEDEMIGNLFLNLARMWKRPIREIKQIVRGSQNDK